MPYKDADKRREAVRKSQAKHSEKWKEYRKRYAKAHPELYRKATRKYRERNREKVNAASRAYWHQLPVEQRKQKQLAANLGRFGFTPESYAAKLQEQGGVCAICGNPPELERLHIDHDHSCCHPARRGAKQSCGKCIRGLLCSACNLNLHRVEDSGWLAKATAYLRKFVV